MPQNRENVAWCLDCEWHTKSQINAQAKSIQHARKYSHRVEGELGIGFVYDFRDTQNQSSLGKVKT